LVSYTWVFLPIEVTRGPFTAANDKMFHVTRSIHFILKLLKTLSICWSKTLLSSSSSFFFFFCSEKNLQRRPINFSSTFHPLMFCSPKLQYLRIATKCLVKYSIKKKPFWRTFQAWPNNISPSNNNPCLWSPFPRSLSYLPMRVVGN